MVTTPIGDATSITVRWQRPDPPNGIIIAYYIQYGIISQDNQTVKVTEGLNDTVLEFELTGLVADSNYSIRVTMKNSHHTLVEDTVSFKSTDGH